MMAHYFRSALKRSATKPTYTHPCRGGDLYAKTQSLGALRLAEMRERAQDSVCVDTSKDDGHIDRPKSSRARPPRLLRVSVLELRHYERSPAFAT
jgi:hypothetical protein